MADPWPREDGERLLADLRVFAAETQLPEWEAALLERQSVRIDAERRVLEAAKAWKAARGPETPTSRYLPRVRDLAAAVDALVALESTTGQSGVEQ